MPSGGGQPKKILHHYNSDYIVTLHDFFLYMKSCLLETFERSKQSSRVMLHFIFIRSYKIKLQLEVRLDITRKLVSKI